MARKFQLQLTNEREPILIVADTNRDAMAQMRELKRHTRSNVVSFFEVFERTQSAIKENPRRQSIG